MGKDVQVIRIPQDLGESTEHRLHRTDSGTLVSYLNQAGMSQQRVLICMPTVVFIRRGVKRLHLGSCNQTIAPGSVILLSRGLHIMTEILEGIAPYESTLLCLEDTFLRSFAARYPQDSSENKPASPGPSWPILTPKAYLADLLERLPDVLANAPDRRLVELKVEEVILAMNVPEAREFWQQAFHDAHSEGDAGFRDVIERHCLTAVTNAELATLTHRSLSSFKRDFTRIYGSSPARWLLKRRLDHAAGLLSTNTCDVTEACWQSGFSDVSSFIRAFKRHFSTTPKQFQKLQSA